MFTVTKTLILFSLGIYFGSGALGVEKGLSPQSQRAIREAENLSLLKDRLPACTALIRTIKKATPVETPILREKLSQLAKYFYTDKGYQDSILGKEFFEKQKFTDAIEKLNEADDLEKGNTEVLHYLALSQLWLKKGALADATNKRALQINPFDVDVLRDQLAILAGQENWEEAVRVGQSLAKDFNDTTAQTLYFLSLGFLKTGAQTDGEKLMNEVLAKDATLPEPYYWLVSKETSSKEATRLMAKYVELCSLKAPKVFERDPTTCIHLDEAKKIVALAPTPTPKALVQKKDHK